MHHLAAYYGSIANVANTDTPAVTDSILAIQNGHFLPQSDMQLVFAGAVGALLNRARIASPRLRQITLPFIRPSVVGATFGNPVQVADYSQNTLKIGGLEELEFDVTNSAAGPTDTWGIIGLRNGKEPAPQGDIYTIRGSSTTVATALAWSQITMTWADILPAGLYAIVGLQHISTGPIAARLILENQTWRPGAPSAPDITTAQHPLFLKGGLGSWGNFRSTRMPIVEVLCIAADATHEIYLDIVRIA